MIASDPDVPRQYPGVMVSSTFRHLQQHRAALMGAIEGQGLHAVVMEQDAALPDGTVVDASLRKVRDASAYVGHHQPPVRPDPGIRAQPGAPVADRAGVPGGTAP